MNNTDTQYQSLLKLILDKGREKQDRTSTGTIGIHGHIMRFDLKEGFPLLTTKKLHLKSIIHEILWFLRGDTNLKYLVENGCNIWNEWPYQNYLKEAKEKNVKKQWLFDTGEKVSYEEFKEIKHLRPFTLSEYIDRIKTDDVFAKHYGNCGPIYGKQWVAWDKVINDEMAPEFDNRVTPINQIQYIIDTLKNNPNSRRLVVNAWNVSDLSEMCLTPCHCLFQFHTTELTVEERIDLLPSEVPANKNWEGSGLEEIMITYNIPKFRLDLQLYQRSCDTFLGVPFNIASYALLLQMVAQCTNMVANNFIWTGGDIHLYSNHIEQANLQLTREPRPLPIMKLNPNVKDIFSFQYEDFTLEGYNPHPGIKADVSI